MNATTAASKRRLFLRTVAVFGLLFGLVATPASADDVVVPLTKVVVAEPGSVNTVAEAPIDAEHVGMSCVATIVAQNQESKNPNTDLIITSGDATVVIAGIEDEPNGETKQSAPMIVGDSVTVQVRIGPSGVASMGFSLSFECKPPETPPAKPVQKTPTYTG